jgi:hypothetical protein
MAETTQLKAPKSTLIHRRERGTNLRIGTTEVKRKVAAGKNGKEYASAGPGSYYKEATHEITDTQITRIRNMATSGAPFGAHGWGMYELTRQKTAALFSDGTLGNADIADSNNIGYYSYEFPVDALELPASRAEELRFYRLAYDRDPIVGRAIDMHTELPLSKWSLEKPKCSSENFADYVYDYFQGIMSDTRFFQVLIQAVREYWCIGEAFLFIQEEEDIEPCKMAKAILEKAERKRNKRMGQSTEPGLDGENPPMGGTSDQILDFLQPSKRSSWLRKRSAEIDEIKKAGIGFDPGESVAAVKNEIRIKKGVFTKKANKLAGIIKIASTLAAQKDAKIIQRDKPEGPDDEYPIQVTAAPMPPPAEPTPPGGADDAAPPAGDEGAPLGDAGLEGVAGADPAAGGGMPGDDLGGDLGGGMPLMGGGGGGGGFGGPSTPPDQMGMVQDAIAQGSTIKKQQELLELKRYIKLLEKKKQVLEELKEIREKRKIEEELFSHLENEDYDGFDKIQVLPPEQIEVEAGTGMGGDSTIFYKPLEKQKTAYLEDPDVDSEVKGMLEQDGKIALNKDALKGSYVIQFARKKSDYELHGRSILQRCIRTVIYREKLRQVQSTLASRNMTPKTLVIAPDIPPAEVMALRAHVDEAKADPDYSVVLNYEARWDEIGSDGRLLSLEGEWTHTNSDLAIGIGFSPEILIGEGLYSGNKVQLQLIETSYLQFRVMLADIIEQQIFRFVAMKKGFYELDKWGKPRWIFPKVSFSRLALRDAGDVYDMLYNLYSKGSIPTSIILEFLEIDPEDCKRKLEEDLFTVNDAKFTELLSTLYNSIGEAVFQKSDIVKRAIKGLGLDEVDQEPEQGPEGSGQGM